MRLLAFALAVEFGLRFVARVEAPHLAQLIGGCKIERAALRLMQHNVRDYAEPGKIDLNRLHELWFRALRICVIKSQYKSAMVLFREKKVHESRARVANVNMAGWRGSKTDNGRRHGS